MSALTSVAIAEDEPQVLTETSSEKVILGQWFRYQITLNHIDNPSEPVLQGLDNFIVEKRGERNLNSRHRLNVNGRVTEIIRRGRAYYYELTPRTTGMLTLPAPSAEVDGKILRGESLDVMVIGRDESDFVQMDVSVDRTSVYPLQPFAVTLTVAVRELPAPNGETNPLEALSVIRRRMSRLRLPEPQTPRLEIPWADDEKLDSALHPKTSWQQWVRPWQQQQGGSGFAINQIRQEVFFGFEARPVLFHPKPQRVVRADSTGQMSPYWEFKIARTFTPQTVGTYGFGPASVTGDFVAVESQPPVKDRYAWAPRLEVRVKDVPQQGRPDSYVGAIGNFQVDGSLHPTKSKVGDPMTLTIALNGQGTLDRAVAPDLSAISQVTNDFKIYEPTTTETDGDTRRFTYGLRPLHASVTQFPEIPISYFDVDQEQYVNLHTPAIAVEVQEATHLSSDDIAVTDRPPVSSQPDGLEMSKDGIFENVADLSALRDQSVRPDRWLFGLAGLASVYFAVATVNQQWNKRASDPAARRRRQAAANVQRRLKHATSLLDDHQPQDSVDAIRSAVVGLAADVAGVSEVGVATGDVCAQLAALDVPDAMIDKTARLLDECDRARYGGAQALRGELLQDAKKVIQSLLAEFRTKKRLR